MQEPKNVPKTTTKANVLHNDSSAIAVLKAVYWVYSQEVQRSP